MRAARPTDLRAGHRFRPGPTSSAETAAGSSETRSGSGIAPNAGGNFKSKQGEKKIRDNSAVVWRKVLLVFFMIFELGPCLEPL